MKNLSLSLLLIFTVFTFSCNTYKIKYDLGSAKSFKNLSHTGVIFRLSSDPMVTFEELERNMSVLHSSYSMKLNLSYIKPESTKLSVFSRQAERLYQVSDEGKYLKYKSRGMLAWYLNNSKDELITILKRQGLDSLLIFEVDGGYYPNMGFISYNGVVALVDRNLNITYMDHNYVNFELEDYNPEQARVSFVDRVTGRLFDIFEKMNLAEKIKLR